MNVPNHPFRHPWFAAAALLASVGFAAPAGSSEWAEIGDPYPLLNCIVTEEPLDEDALVFTYQGREIRTCCFDCEDDLKQDFDTWIRMIDDRIIQQQQAYYPLATCVVDGKALKRTGALNFVFRNRLFMLGSFECQEELERQPGAYFAKLNQAVIEKQKPTYPLSTCIITGRPLGDTAIDLVVGNQLVRLFDSGQLNGLDENPGRHLSELRELGRKQSAAPEAVRK